MKFIIWLSFLILVFIHQVLQHILSIQLYWIDCYLDAMLFFPIVLPVWKWERNHIFAQKNISALEYFSVVTSLSIIAEFILPYFGTQYTSDPIDLILYYTTAYVTWSFLKEEQLGRLRFDN